MQSLGLEWSLAEVWSSLLPWTKTTTNKRKTRHIHEILQVSYLSRVRNSPSLDDLPES